MAQNFVEDNVLKSGEHFEVQRADGRKISKIERYGLVSAASGCSRSVSGHCESCNEYWSLIEIWKPWAG
jgi:hypothetical protein